MDASNPHSFKGTIFHVWKSNQTCRVYVTDRHVYFIRRAAGINPGAAGVIGSQFGLLGGLAVGLAGARNARRSDLVRDDDFTHPDQLLTKHADNFAIPVSDILDPKIEPEGKYMSYGKNSGRWRFTRRGASEETVVLFDSSADAGRAVFLLGGPFGSRLRNEAGIVGTPPPDADRGRGTKGPADDEIVTDLPVPPEHAEIINAMQGLTHLLAERAPAAWQKIRCEVRAASRESSRPLDIVVGYGLDELRPDADPAIDQAAMRLARKLSTSVRTFPGVTIEVTKLDDGRWHNNMKLIPH